MLAKTYRKFVSKRIRKIIYKAFLGDLLFFFQNYKLILKGRSLYLWYSVISPKTEKCQVLRAWGRNAPTPYPYIWIKEYKKRDYAIILDEKNELPFVMHNGRKLYFKRDMLSSSEECYRGLLIEQDKRSAHRYVNEYEELKGKTLLDIGAAEAIFTLDAIDYVEHAYLFECDEDWIEALNATFTPWRDKITIVRKYVSDVDDEFNLTLDNYFRDKPTNNLFVKMDIEGYERKALRGGNLLLKNAIGISGAVCIYHLNDDEEIIRTILSQNNLSTEVVPGYLYFEKELRHAIMRFER